MKTHYLLFIISLHRLDPLFDHVLGGYLCKFCQISNLLLFNLRNDKCCLKICGKLESAVWEVLGIELLVVNWIGGRQACCLAWVNLTLRSPLLLLFFPLFSFCFLLLLAQLMNLSFLVKIGLFPWSGHCWIPALGI